MRLKTMRPPQLRYAFEPRGEDGPAWQRRGPVIYLNIDNPAIKADSTDRRAMAVHAIYATAIEIARDGDDQWPGLEEFLYSCESDTERIAKLAGYLLSRSELPAAER
jgi:hypothetical protein